MTAKPSYEELERRIEELEKADNVRNKIKKELQKSEARHSKMVANIGDVVVIIDQEGINRYKSPNIEKIFGWKPEEVVGTSTWDNVHPDDIEFTQQFFEKIMLTPDAVGTMECRYRCKDGSYKWIEFSGSNLFHDPDIQGLLGNYQDITERKQAEAMLRESEERIRTIGNNLQGAQLYQLRVAPDGGTMFTYVSSKVEELYECKPEDVLKDASLLFKRVHPADVDEWKKLTHKSQRELTTYDHTVRIVRKSGEIRWHRMISKPRKLDDGSVLFDGVELDVTDRKQAEEALRESEDQISSIFRSAPVGIGSVVNRVLRKVNDRLCEMTGYDESELIGQSARMLYPSDKDFAFVGREKYAQISDHSTGTVETRWQKKDGTIIDVLLSSTPVDLKDQSKGVTFTALDITERKQAENALESERRFLTAVFDNIEEAIVICDENGALVRFNDAARKLHGLPEQPIKPEQWSEYYNLFREDGITPLPVEEIPLYRALQGEHVRDVEIVVSSRNNTPLYLICNGQKLTDNTGRINGAVVAMHDDTRRRMAEMDQKKLQTQLNQAQKMESVGRLAGGVAHDFNNMLGVILGHTELALLKAEEDNDLISDLKEIQTAAKRSADITKQLLAFARKEIISPRKIDLNDTVESMLNMLRRLIGEDIDLVWQPAAHIWPVKMDPTQIDQILANLCVNARDAISGVGKLTIETGRKTFDEEYCKEHAGFIPGDFVLLAVSDNGCGMDKDTLENLFEPFFTTKDVGKGTGLGLATIYGIVKQNNGFINVYSEPDQGSTFKIYLSRLVADEDIDKAVPQKKAAAGGTETIILVEDEPSILRMTRMMLEKKGYSVLSAATPAEAVKKAKNHSGSIDLLMTDVVMPEMNGRDLAGQIVHLYPGIRLLFMSGYTANVIAHQGILDDGVAFIQKPFSMADMTEKVRNILDSASGKD